MPVVEAVAPRAISALRVAQARIVTTMSLSAPPTPESTEELGDDRRAAFGLTFDAVFDEVWQTVGRATAPTPSTGFA